MTTYEDSFGFGEAPSTERILEIGGLTVRLSGKFGDPTHNTPDEERQSVLGLISFVRSGRDTEGIAFKPIPEDI